MFVTETPKSNSLPGASAARSVAVLLVAFGVAALCGQPAVGDVFEEVHPFTYSVENPAWSSTCQYTYDMPLFNTYGGTRTLTAFRVDYSHTNTYSYSFNDNMTANWLGCDKSWNYSWTSTRDGARWFPLNQSSGKLSNGAGVGGVLAPYTVGYGPVQYHSGSAGYESLGDASLLATMTGTGTVPVLCTETLSAVTTAAPTRWPSYVPVNLRVFDPNLITVAVDRLTMDLTLTYYYTPEPGSLSLLGFGLALLLRRRR